jgi:hypothetical protein
MGRRRQFAIRRIGVLAIEIVNGASAWTAEERDSSRRRTRRPEDTHRRDLESLGDSMVTVFSRRDRGQVVALKRLDEHPPGDQVDAHD